MKAQVSSLDVQNLELHQNVYLTPWLTPYLLQIKNRYGNQLKFWLGISVNLNKGCFYVSEERISNLPETVNYITKNP